jgi:hypothetical protein
MLFLIFSVLAPVASGLAILFGLNFGIHTLSVVY